MYMDVDVNVKVNVEMQVKSGSLRTKTDVHLLALLQH